MVVVGITTSSGAPFRSAAVRFACWHKGWKLHSKMAKEPQQDGSVTDTLEEKAQDRAVGAAAGDSASVMDTLKGGVETVKGAFSTVTGGMGKAWSTLGEWKDEGVCVEGCIVLLGPTIVAAMRVCEYPHDAHQKVCVTPIWNTANRRGVESCRRSHEVLLAAQVEVRLDGVVK